jgi:hypothetical protein
MPINQSLFKSLVKKYGYKRGKDIYFSMESEGKPAFRKGLKTAKKEGHIVKKAPK